MMTNRATGERRLGGVVHMAAYTSADRIASRVFARRRLALR